LYQALSAKFEYDEIKRFVERSEASFREAGRLPLARHLGKRQREIRKFITDGGYGRREISKVFEVF